MPIRRTYIVEHLDPELGPWSALEYRAIARETAACQGTFMLSSLPAGFQVPEELAREPAFKAETRGVEELYPAGQGKERVCLLDPAADKDLNPDDRHEFDVFLFGGILGKLERGGGVLPTLQPAAGELSRPGHMPRGKRATD